MQEQHENNDETIKWSTKGFHDLIKSIHHKAPAITVETISIVAILKSSLYMWYKIKGETTNLAPNELVEFISLENCMSLTVDEKLSQEDREYVKMYLSCLPGYQPNLHPDKQQDALKNLFSAAQLLVIAEHAER